MKEKNERMRMKKKEITLFLVLSVVALNAESQVIIENNFEFAEKQYQGMIHKVTDTTLFPRTVKQDQLWLVPADDWTSGFWPGALWYLYEHTNKEEWKKEAIRRTDGLKNIQYFTDHHDVGFMMYCSYGNAFRLTANPAYVPILVQSAKSLCKRYSYNVGCIQSWNARTSIGGKNNWDYPVIIDNMMNLELLFWATQATGDSIYWKIAVSHAEKTLKNHIRADYSCYHVVNYDPQTGDVLHKQTAQGFADNSTWSRGQAWGIYSFTMVYRFTGDERFLHTATKMVDLYLNHKYMPEDMIPYWDFNTAQKGYNPDFDYKYEKYIIIPRDASSAAIVASALLELCNYVEPSKSQNYINAAAKMLHSLSSENYRAHLGDNQNFLLKHSVGNLPGNNEIDVPLIYADYYFLEAMLRWKKNNIGDLK